MAGLETMCSVEHDLCELLQRHGTLRLDDIVMLLNEYKWSEIFLSIGQLARLGSITITMQGQDYFLSIIDRP